MVKVCTKCGKKLSRQNKSGLCVPHWVEHTRSPEWRERVSRMQRRLMMERPELKARRKELGLQLSALPQSAEGRRRAGEAARERGYWKVAIAAASTMESRQRAARTWSEKKLGWCPPELRDDYRALVTRHKVRAADARGMILAQHEKDMREFRRSIGG